MLRNEAKIAVRSHDFMKHYLVEVLAPTVTKKTLRPAMANWHASADTPALMPHVKEVSRWILLATPTG